MASSSSTTSTVMTSCAKAFSYDVFLSFRGEDTRYSFTDHLYHKLIQSGISTFRDEEEIDRGEELKHDIEIAIKSSRASIVVLSTNYGASCWCLDEVVAIMEQRRECNQYVLPVFYHVKPADVRKQTGSFDIQVKPCSRWTDDNVNKWKTALTQVADLAGMELFGPETSFMKDIVDTIYNKLDHKEVHLPVNITGMDIHDKEIKSWLQQGNPELLAIYGMGGSGKTTLAKYIYNLNQNSFECMSFVENIGSRCEGPNDLLKLQKQLLKDLLHGKKRKIPGVSQGTCMIEEVLIRKKALIVLDDIVEHSHLVTLLGSGRINAQSKIIITTTENTDKWFGFWKCKKYEIKLLKDDESSELLCRHAFGSKSPKAGFEDLVQQAVAYCEGHPLALEVLGSSLFNNNTVPSWKSQLNILEKDIHSRIQGVLVRSYKSLPYDSQKELFLHIACFFIGKDIDYAVKILEPDYSAISGIKTLVNRCLLSVSSNNKLIMHRLVQEMGKHIVRQESTKFPAKRSRVWLNSDSYEILKERKGSKPVEGLALDMKMLSEENLALQTSNLPVDTLERMVNLKLLQLNFVGMRSYGYCSYVSKDLRWLCWLGYHLKDIPFGLYTGNLVAIDMSYSKLESFEPPMVLHSLQILNLKDSHNLSIISNIFNIPRLETLVLWNCFSLIHVCKTIGDLTSLTLLNTTGCKKLFRHTRLSSKTFSFPSSLHRLFLKDCNLESDGSFPFNFNAQPHLQYLNLGNSPFESFHCYNNIENLQVLDLSSCSRLKCVMHLPSTLAELYVYDCELLEKITFQTSRFTLQEIGYLGCIHLCEIEGFFKLVPVAILDEAELGHLKWLKEYQNYEVCLVGDDELTVGRSWHIQMLYEFGIISTSLPDINDPNMTSEYISKSTYLSFDVPSCPENKRLIGINLTLKYAISGEDCAWFCKISTTNGGVDFMYNPKVFGKPETYKECIWLSYWPIGNKLNTGDIVNVSIVVLSGLEVHECGVSLVYSDKETLENNVGLEEILGGDLSGFKLSTGAYYLCRRDFFELMEVGSWTPGWFRILVGENIDYTEVRGWRKTGRPKQVNDPSFTELKMVRCIIDGPDLEDIYNVAGFSKLSTSDITLASTSSLLKAESKE